MRYHQELVFLVLHYLGYTLSIMTSSDSVPKRRMYYYNPDLISHAASALSLFGPQAGYKPLQFTEHLDFSHYGDVEDDYEEEFAEPVPPQHQNPQNLQLFAFIKPPKNKNKNRNKTRNKNSNKRQKQQKNKGMHKQKKNLKKMIKKCLPFKVRIIKKSDVFKGDRPLYVNNYGNNGQYRSNDGDVALISFNTSGILSNKSRFPPMLHFVYPRHKYKAPSRKIVKIVPRRTFSKPIIRYKKKRWSPGNKWRLAPPGKPLKEFKLNEPSPGATGGSPPPSPLYNVYKDNRIPVSQDYLQLKENSLSGETDRYSELDYYRYGIYDQDRFNDNEAASRNRTAETGKYYYRSTITESPDKVVTVTPSTSWVPIPNPKNVVSYRSGGFKSSNQNCTKRYIDNQLDGSKCATGSGDQARKKGRSNFRRVDDNDEVDIVTAMYPEDDFSKEHVFDGIRNRRSGEGLSAVVSGSLMVNES